MTLQERDKQHIWHPLTQHQLHPDHIAITRAKGVLLYDSEGNEYIDGIASWYTCMYGHCNEYITQKVATQMQELDHVVFTGFTHEPAVRLSEELIKVLPDNQQKIFFSDNGSTSVDVAIKMALQYYWNQGKKRSKIIALEHGFHGDTFGAMSVSGLSVYNAPFEDFSLDVMKIPVPNQENFAQVKEQFQQYVSSYEVAAFIYEPLLQGAAAMKMYDSEFLEQLLTLAQQHDVLAIADEVMTGFGKTGKHFASSYMRYQPDIMCMSKSLTAGLLPMAITSCTQKVYGAFLSNDVGKGFFHGHTYSANPIACTAALAGIELLQTTAMQDNIQRVIQSHQEFDTHIKDHPNIQETRQLGIVYALDLCVKMERYGNLRNQLFQFFMEQGVYLRPLGNTIYILAPYVITREQLQTIYTTIEKALDMFS
jgi:adenosylmethionine-8-amino-7-oxononanoate aminotransferase